MANKNEKDKFYINGVVYYIKYKCTNKYREN